MFDPESDTAFAAANQREARNYAKFYRNWVRNNFRSNEQGCEVGDYQDFILIVCPGQPKSEVRRKANNTDKLQYREEWRAYEEGKEHQVSGTPIEMLPGIGAGVPDMLKTLYIYTIEQMAELSDIALQKVGMGGNEIRQKAKLFLGKNSVEVARLKEELEMANATMERANATIAELRGQIAQLEAAKKPGRKPKLAAVA